MTKSLKTFFFSRSLNRFMSNFEVKMKDSYEDAIVALNELQSNMAFIQNANNNANSYKLSEIEKFMNRSGITLDDLDKLSVIHVSGTKGKGTTCAICENILQQHSYKTGFFSSPHLVEVRERIRINGVPLEKEKFAQYFWEVYKNCDDQKENAGDMPRYFGFLTIMAFYVFLKENIDVAIVEVGIGGELDCTNITRKTDVVGITSLGIEHTVLLGNTIEKIAWQKGGIIKEGCRAFSAPQTEKALNILQERCREKNCLLTVVKPCDSDLKMIRTFMPLEIFKINASLAVALAKAWVEIKGREPLKPVLIKQAVENTCWAGRFQIISKNNTKIFLDGAHTKESLDICINWFLEQLPSKNPEIKALIFNVTGNRNSEQFLRILQKCRFNNVYFVLNKSFSTVKNDQKYKDSSSNYDLTNCENHKEIWQKLEKEEEFRSDKVEVFNNVHDVFQTMWKDSQHRYKVLVTGSLHLVGAALAVVEKNTKM